MKATFEENWKMSEGVPCQKCSHLSLYLPDGVCRSCHRIGMEKEALKREKRAIRWALAHGQRVELGRHH